MHNKVILRFCIWGFEDISHDEISQKMGLAPNRIYIKGQKKNPNFSALAKENGWLFQPSGDSSIPFEDQFRLLLGIIEDKKTFLKLFAKSIIAKFPVEFLFILTMKKVPHLYIFDPKHYKVLNDLNMAFDVDIYCLLDSEISGLGTG